MKATQKRIIGWQGLGQGRSEEAQEGASRQHPRHHQACNLPSLQERRRGGVKRINGLIYKETRGVLKIFLENVIRDAVTYTEHANKKTMTAIDVVESMISGLGWFLLGFWEPYIRKEGKLEEKGCLNLEIKERCVFMFEI
ncbi:hypothetical protein L1049_002494 [Liquidambar formosana]|uniref:Histone H4 n=1 Tax=Liquidambar formosana TaxID=63359 RepID=A0AAP0NJT1_LIQFO